MTYRSYVFPTAALALVFALASAAAAVSLARPLKKGETARYTFVVKGMVLGTEFESTGKTKVEIRDVKENGDVTRVESVEESKLTVAGQEMPVEPQPAVTTTHDRLGKLIQYEPTPNPLMAPEVLRLMTALGEPILPGKEIEDNAAWETEIDNPAAAGRKVTIKTAYAGTEKLGDLELWKIRQTAEAETGQVALLKSEATYWLDPKSGHTVRMEAKLTDVPTQFGQMSWTETRERIKE
jgi:hypothetical protein